MALPLTPQCPYNASFLNIPNPFASHALVPLAHPHDERNARRGGNPQPYPHAPRRAGQPGHGRGLYLPAAGAAGPEEGRADRPPGDGRRRGGGTAHAGPHAHRPVRAERADPRLRRRADQVRGQAAEPQGPDGPGAHARRDDHRPGRASDLQLPADADHDVPDPDQVPQRRAAPLRRAAHQRIPHEGRLQLRRHARRPEQELRRHVRGLLPHLRALRAGLPGRRGGERADRRRRQP